MQGLGPLFKLKLNLQNMGTKPIQDLEMTFAANPMLYKLKARVLHVRTQRSAARPRARAAART